ncbi:hypothetical protein D5S18_02115 [Nocardia panacis]|uniref:Uncharacterized protein n=1 Tax=Nocardia panacis TaxID=2340916 RepID=A0A3A4KSA5_9NOCA|nr:hypothetical protein [Nocardia panacis]RJO79166.1 hypothetical protein D5S18_02115 [Nocardia panacis]
MQEAPTPQQALDIATATTRQAHEAAALPRWEPVVTAALGALASFLLCMLVADGIERPFGWMILIGGIGLGWMYFRLAQRQRRTQRARGIVPLPMVEWKQIMGMLVVILVVPLAGHAVSGSDGGIRIASSIVLSGWIWFMQARPRILSRRT